MEMIKLTPDFKEFLQLLNSEKIEYLLIGGYAVNLYGLLRPTKDMDIWVALEEANLNRLIEAMVKFGFRRESLSTRLFKGVQTVFRMGLPPNRLEIVTSISGVQFAECYARREIVTIEGLVVPVISYPDLRTNKLATTRAKDRADIEALDKQSRKS